MVINICLSTDKFYLPHLTTTIKSIVENNQDFYLKIYIINKNLDNKSFQGINESILHNRKVEIINCKFDSSFLNDFPVADHFSIETYYRLFINKFLGNKKIIYLDSDLIVCGSLEELWNIKLGEFCIGAVAEGPSIRHEGLGMNRNEEYFNAGVMLIDLKKWNEQFITEKCLAFLEKFRRNIEFADQDALNGILKGKWLELDPKFNVSGRFFERKNRKSNIPMPQNPLIVHFSGNIKPWHFASKHPFKKEYWYYRNKTIYKSYLADDFSIINVIKAIIPNFIKKFIKKILSN